MAATRPDPLDLRRFVEAQDGVYETALAEVKAGRKRSHWMWFVFPQLRGLGHSSTAWHYGLASLAEAEAYLAHTILGPRLRECTDAVLEGPERSLHALFGVPDDLKFRSSMTLFAEAAGGREPRFGDALDRFCEGRPDTRTIAALRSASR